MRMEERISFRYTHHQLISFGLRNENQSLQRMIQRYTDIDWLLGIPFQRNDFICMKHTQQGYITGLKISLDVLIPKIKPNQEPLNKYQLSLLTQRLTILKPRNYICKAEKRTCITGCRCRKLDVDGTKILYEGKLSRELQRLKRRHETLHWSSRTGHRKLKQQPSHSCAT